MNSKPQQLAHSYVNVYDFPMPYGFSIYRGVLIVWDEDYDPRILGMIDDMPDQARKEVLAAYEHEGGLSLLWTDDDIAPSEYDPGELLDVRGSDVWAIHEWEDYKPSPRRPAGQGATKGHESE